MGEFTIQCTMCEGSFGSETEYNSHGCTTDEDVKFPVKIKLEPDEDDEVAEALLSFTASVEELEQTIKNEPIDESEIIKDEEKSTDPLSLSSQPADNETIPEQCSDNLTSTQVTNETDTFTERYTKDKAEEGNRDLEMTELIDNPALTNYTCSCNICNSVFCTKDDFNKHFQDTHKTYRYRPYKCGICGKKFLHKHYVNLHMRVHTGEKPYICKLCPRSYSHKTSFTIHMRIHNGDRPYVCSVCGKKCYDKSGLTSHMRSHTKETPYQCEVCGRRFTHSKSLLVHRRNHTGEKPYICSYCGKAFRHWHKHKIHVRLHTGERPYKCKVCGKGFPRNDEVSRHMRSHQGIKSFKCSICGVYCATQASITGHINLHHSNLKNNDMEPPPEKTFVRNSNTGILGSKIPEPRSLYRAVKEITGNLNSNIPSPSTSKVSVSSATKVSQPVSKSVSTRVIEVTSKDTPISINTKTKRRKFDKPICSSLNSNNNSGDSEEQSPMSYKDFLEWQERMLTNQGLVVKSYPSTKASTSGEGLKRFPQSTICTATPAAKTTTVQSLGKDGPRLSTIQPTATTGKPQYLLLSQGGDGNVTKILLPINMVGQQTGTTKNPSPITNIPNMGSIVPSVQPTVQQQQQQGNRPILLLSQHMQNQPLLLLSNGGQKMLLVSPQGAGRPSTVGGTQLAIADKPSDKITVKKEPVDQVEQDSILPQGVTIKTERESSPIPDIFSPQIRIKEEPL